MEAQGPIPELPCAGGLGGGGHGVCGTLERELLNARYHRHELGRRGGSEDQKEKADKAIAKVEADIERDGKFVGGCETDTAVLLEKYA